MTHRLLIALPSLLLALPAHAQKTPDVRLDTSPAGASFSSQPELCAHGDKVYVAWNDDRNSGGSDIFFQLSTDRGETWLGSDVRLDTDVAGAAQSLQTEMACEGDNVYVVWSDFRNGGSLGADIYLNYSNDGGVTWQPSDIRLDTDAPGSGASRTPVICADSSGVYVAWLDDRNGGLGTADIYFNVSTDNGATWLGSDVRLNTNAAASSIIQSPSIHCDSGSVFVAWPDFRNGAPDIYYNVSTNAGSTWLGSDLRLDTDTAGANSSTGIDINSNGSFVYVCWWDTRSGAEDIYLARSTDGGLSFAAEVRLDTNAAGASLSQFPQIGVDGSNVVVVWEDWRSTPPPSTCPAEVYGNRSADNGATWLVSDFVISKAPTCTGPNPDHTPATPQIAGTNVGGTSYFHVAWTDTRNGLQDIYYSRSRDGGLTWPSVDARLDRDTAGSSFSTSQSIDADGGRIYVAWEDDRNGATDIYFNIPNGMQEYGTGLAGTGGFVPRVSGNGSALIGDTFSLDITDGIGGGLVALCIGAVKSSTPFQGGTLLTVPVTCPAIPLGGAAGVGGAGSISLPLTIPDDEIFIGGNLFFQIIGIDPAAPVGLSFSNGMALYIG